MELYLRPEFTNPHSFSRSKGIRIGEEHDSDFIGTGEGPSDGHERQRFQRGILDAETQRNLAGE